MKPSLPRHAVIIALGLFVSTACSESTGPGDSDGSLRVLSGPIPTDTVRAADSIRIQFEVLDFAVPKAGVTVIVGGPYREQHPALLFPGVQFPAIEKVVKTDANGRASVSAIRGSLAGDGYLRVQAPRLGLDDSIPFTIRPGNGARIIAAPADTAVLAGGSYQLRAQVVDQYGNTVSEGLTYSAASQAISLSGQGLVEGRTFGRAAMEIRSGALSATARVSVVPAATLAVTLTPLWAQTIRTDGSQSRIIQVQTQETQAERGNAWMPDGSRFLLFTGSIITGGFALSLDLNGKLSHAIESSSGVAESWPHPSADGAWIYFVGSHIDGTHEVYRARADGTNPEPVGLVGNQPSPSPDGTRLAFSTATYPWEFSALGVFLLATREVRMLPVVGTKPRWSPAGDQIAFADENGRILTVRPDGSNLRVVSSPDSLYLTGRVDWSPDGRWIAARGQEVVHLIEAGTGLTLPLPHVIGLEPAWKPVP